MTLAEKDMRVGIQLAEDTLEGVFSALIAENVNVMPPVGVVQIHSIGIVSTNPAAERLFPTPGSNTSAARAFLRRGNAQSKRNIPNSIYERYVKYILFGMILV